MARLFIRTEASNAIGLGHFMRCFAIAEEARARDIEVVFLLNETGDAVQARCRQIGAIAKATPAQIGSIEDIEGIIASGLERDDWVIFDTYRNLKNARVIWDGFAHVMILDDLALPMNVRADLVVNPAMSASEMGYGKQFLGFQRALLGPDYALIRREFRVPPAPTTDTQFVVVMFGGSDPRQLTGGCAAMLRAAMPGIRLKIIAGPAHIHTEALRALAGADPLLDLHVDPPSVAQVLAGCDLVLTAAGGSVGEMAAMGLAALVLVLYDNQKAALAQCPFPVIDARGGLPADLGLRARGLVDDPTGLKAIADKAHRIVDGKGAKRVVEAMFGA